MDDNIIHIDIEPQSSEIAISTSTQSNNIDVSFARDYVAWGSISGDINDQTDLKNALDGKQPVGDYATNTALSSGLATKQNAISDLETIRSGAAAGATALQPETAASTYVDKATAASTYVDKAGDTMTGALTVQANITSTGDVSAANVTATTKMTTVTPATGSDDTTVPTTAWVKSILGSANMLGRMNYNAAVSISLSNNGTYTAPSKGYIYVSEIYGSNTIPFTTGYINDNALFTSTVTSSIDAGSYVRVFYPVSQGDVLKVTGQSSYTLLKGFFAPQI